MPDGRFLSKAIAHDLELNTVVSFEADYLFSRCIPHLDREGRMPGHPSQVKAIACPLREKITIDAINRCLSELAAAKLVTWYEVEGRAVLEFPGFQKHQKGLRKNREAESNLPSSKVHKAKRLTTLLRSNSGPDPDQLPLSEVKGSEGRSVARTREASELTESDRQGDDASELADWLGDDHADVVERFVEAVGADAQTLTSIFRTFGPKGTQGERILAKLDADEQRSAMAASLEALIGERQAYRQNFFRAILASNVSALVGEEPEGGNDPGRINPSTFGDDLDKEMLRQTGGIPGRGSS